MEAENVGFENHEELYDGIFGLSGRVLLSPILQQLTSDLNLPICDVKMTLP
jgi:hypothetical protein